jgi:hypothetical protein
VAPLISGPPSVIAVAVRVRSTAAGAKANSACGLAESGPGAPPHLPGDHPWLGALR